MSQPATEHVAMSPEYHAAHLAFARASIVEAAANREPILGLLRTYTADVRQAERDAVKLASTDAGRS